MITTFKLQNRIIHLQVCVCANVSYFTKRDHHRGKRGSLAKEQQKHKEKINKHKEENEKVRYEGGQCKHTCVTILRHSFVSLPIYFDEEDDSERTN